MQRLFHLFFISVILFGCREETDLELPTVAIESPVSGGLVTTSEGLRLVATLSDDTGLLQYKVTLNGIDSLNDVAADSTLSWVFIEGVPDEKKVYELDQVIGLPDSTFNGVYQITLACLDVEGNESLRDTVNITIENSLDPVPPVINVGGPFLDTMTIGDGFLPFGQITDERSLIYANVYIGRVDRSDTIHWFQFAQIQNNLVSFETAQTFWVVDSSWAQGSYHMYCTAWDDYSGVSNSIPFYVSY